MPKIAEEDKVPITTESVAISNDSFMKWDAMLNLCYSRLPAAVEHGRPLPLTEWLLEVAVSYRPSVHHHKVRA